MSKLFPMILVGVVATGTAIGLALPTSTEAQPETQSASFSLCHTGGGTNCVVDGDTIWLAGEKIRIADIDTPETHQPRCSAETELGNRATRRMHALLNQGSFSVETIGGRDEDRYGRKLRVITRNGESLGDILVSEGLAREWEGRRRSWCPDGTTGR